MAQPVNSFTSLSGQKYDLNDKNVLKQTTTTDFYSNGETSSDIETTIYDYSYGKCNPILEQLDRDGSSDSERRYFYNENGQLEHTEYIWWECGSELSTDDWGYGKIFYNSYFDELGNMIRKEEYSEENTDYNNNKVTTYNHETNTSVTWQDENKDGIQDENELTYGKFEETEVYEDWIYSHTITKEEYDKLNSAGQEASTPIETPKVAPEANIPAETPEVEKETVSKAEGETIDLSKTENVVGGAIAPAIDSIKQENVNKKPEDTKPSQPQSEPQEKPNFFQKIGNAIKGFFKKLFG